MRLKLGLLIVCGLAAAAQTPGDRELAGALAKIEALRSQVEAGVVPRAKLEEAEESLADARDAELLSHTLYGHDLTEEQSADMEAAALRRLNRRKAAVQKLEGLFESGAVSKNTLDRPNEELKWAQEEYELMVSRSQLVHDLAEQARAEQQAMEAQENAVAVGPSPVMEHFEGSGVFQPRDFARVELAF